MTDDKQTTADQALTATYAWGFRDGYEKARQDIKAAALAAMPSIPPIVRRKGERSPRGVVAAA